MASGGEWDIPRAWEPAREAARAGGLLVLLGASDLGKSTLAAILASDAWAAGRSVAVVDADVGQSSVGPPACVGLGRPAGAIASLSELAAERIDFVGSPSPVGHLLGTIASAAAVSRRAREDGAETTIVDTTGLISGGVARALKGAKIQVLAPDVLVAVQSEDEVEHLLAPYGTRQRPRVIRLRPSRQVAPRTRAERSAHRQRQFAIYFGGGQAHTLDWKQVPVENSAWTAGKTLPGHLRVHAEEVLGQPVRHAERSADGLLLIAEGLVSRAGLREVEETFGPTRVLQAEVFTNLLVGLLGAHGETLALGILESVDFAARRLTVFTPLREPTEARGMRLGFIQLARDGGQLAWLDPADVG